MQGADSSSAVDSGPGPVGEAGGSPLVFWGLLALALAGFLPCVLLPVWREYQAVALAAQVEEQRVEVMRRHVDQQRRALDALREDPAVVARLAQRELAYVRPGQSEVPVPGVARVVAAPATPLTPGAVDPPPPVAAVVARLPKADYDRLFCEEPTRTIVALLSGGVLVAAFAIGRPGRASG